MFFAAKEAVECKARERGRQEGRREGIEEGMIAGRRAERERISKMLEEHGISLSPELAERLDLDPD